MPQPVLKLEEISDELGVLLEKRHQFEKVDEFTLKRLKNEARKLFSKDRGATYMFLGIIGVFEDNISEIHENYKRALDLSKTPSVYFNYGIALSHMGYCSQAFDLFKKTEVTNDKQLLWASWAGIESGRFHETKLLRDKWSKYYPDENSNTQFPSTQLIERVISFMDSKGVSDADLRKLIEVTFDTAQQRGIFTFKSETCLSPDEDTFCFEYWIEIPVDVETVVELNMQLDSAIIEQCPPSIAKQSGFVPLFITARDE